MATATLLSRLDPDVTVPRFECRYCRPPVTDVLVVAAEHRPWSNAAAMGAAIAGHWRASLTVCSTSATDQQAAPGRTEALADAFHIPNSEFVAGGAWSGDAVAALAPWHSLIVADLELFAPGGTFAAAARVMRASQRPWLLVPHGASPVRTFKNILIAWDGSACSTRAFQAAWPFLAQADAIQILDGSTPPSADDVTHRTPERYLRAHGYACEVVTNQWKGEAAGEGMLATARQWPADLLVLGAFGKALWQEEWFGGTSRHVLACADLPILIAH